MSRPLLGIACSVVDAADAKRRCLGECLSAVRAQEVSPTAVDSDALEFDLTIGDSTSESGGDESEVLESPAIAQFSGALISDRSRAQPGVGSGRFAVLAGDEQDDSHFDIRDSDRPHCS